MKVDSGQWTVVRKKDVGTQDRTRENTDMLTYNHQTKARFPLSLDGRGCGHLAAAVTVAALFFAAPQAAQAQCSPTPTGTEAVPAPASGTITCQPGDYAGGIHYDSTGDLTLEVPDDSVDLTVNDGGANVTGNGTDNISWNSSDFTSGVVLGTDGAVIDYLSDQGDINIVTGGNIKGEENATHAIRAESTGGGNVSVTALGTINPRVFPEPQPSGMGIEALTTTGDILIQAMGGVGSGNTPHNIRANSSAGGNITMDILSGSIFASTTGAGNIDVDFNSSNGSGSGIFTSGSGNITLTSNGTLGVVAETGGSGSILIDSSDGISGGTGFGPGIQATADTGDITIDLIDANPSDENSGEIRIIGGTAIVTHASSGSTTTITFNREIVGSGWGSNFGDPDDAAETSIRSSGSGDVVVNVSGITGILPGKNIDGISIVSAPFDFSGLSGNVELNFEAGSLWGVANPDSALSGLLNENRFSSGNVTVNIAAGASLATPLTSNVLVDSPTVADDLFTVDFAGGNNVFNNAGDVFVGAQTGTAFGRNSEFEGELRLENLAEFNNSGSIWLGGFFGEDVIFQSFVPDFSGETELWPDDILALPGAHFHGEVDGNGNPLGRIVADVDLGKDQSGCHSGLRNADGDLPAADCIDLRGGSADGRTLFVINQFIEGDRGAYNPDGLTLVDVGGGDPNVTDPDAFDVAPESPQYSPAFGGIIDKGVFFYSIAWDPETQQFGLYGLPSSGSQQTPLLAQAANGLWRTATDAWFDRRVDQRDLRDVADLGSGLWFRTAGGSADRDLKTPIVAGGETFVFDNGYTQDDITATFGMDLISRSMENGTWLVGGMLGYARSQIEFDDSRNSADMEGMHAGLYANLTYGGFFADLALNRTWLDVYNDVPAMDLTPAGTVLETEASSQGAQLEAGWRWQAGRFSVEPLAGYSYVQSDFDDIIVPAGDPARLGAEVQFKDSTSQRGSLGVRLRMDDVAPGIVPTSIGLTARAIEEFDGESEVSVVNLGPFDAPVSNTFDGTFTQVSGDISITNVAKTVAGYLKVDAVTGDDYDSLGLSAGFRYQW